MSLFATAWQVISDSGMGCLEGNFDRDGRVRSTVRSVIRFLAWYGALFSGVASLHVVVVRILFDVGFLLAVIM